MSLGLNGLDKGLDRGQLGQVGLDLNPKDNIPSDYQVDTDIPQVLISLEGGLEFGQDGGDLLAGDGLVDVGFVRVADSEALEA